MTRRTIRRGRLLLAWAALISPLLAASSPREGIAEPDDAPDVAWVIIAPPARIASIADYTHAWRAVPEPEPRADGEPREPLPSAWELEFRRWDAVGRVDGPIRARIPFPQATTRGQLTDTDRRRLGDLPHGRYAVALMDGGQRRSNVALFQLGEPNPPLPTVQVEQVTGPDNAALPYLMVQTIGAADPNRAFTNMDVVYPKLVVDGEAIEPKASMWMGPVGPVPPGMTYQVFVPLSNYEFDEPLRQGQEIAVRIGDHSSAPIAWSAFPLQDRLVRWDVALLTPLDPHRFPIAIMGEVRPPPGDEPKHVMLVSETGDRYRAKTDRRGGYAFDTIPAGTYTLYAGGQPEFTISGVEIDNRAPVLQDLDFRPHHRIAGRVIDHLGQPAEGVHVSATWEARDGAWEYSDSTATGPDGTYQLMCPEAFTEASFVGGNGFRPRYRVESGREDVDFVLPEGFARP